MIVKLIKKGEIIFNDCSYRAKIVSKIGCGFSLLQGNLDEPSANQPQTTL
jgi:hypothetical protein